MIRDIFSFQRTSNEYKCQCLGHDDMTITSYLKEIIGAKMIACYTNPTEGDKECKAFNKRTDSSLLDIV